MGPFADPALNAGSTQIPDTIFGALPSPAVAGHAAPAPGRTAPRRSSRLPSWSRSTAERPRSSSARPSATPRRSPSKARPAALQLSVEEAGRARRSRPASSCSSCRTSSRVRTRSRWTSSRRRRALTGTGDPSVAPPGFDVFTVGASGLEGTIALPRERSSTILTSMLLESGQTAVLGGLVDRDRLPRPSREVPGLSKIPLLGWLFTYEQRARVRRTT